MRSSTTFFALFVVAGLWSANVAPGQAPGLGGLGKGGGVNNSAAVQAQVQQRIQAQVQARSQTQVEQRLRAQAQARLRAEAARAAQLAEAARRQAGGLQRPTPGNRYGVNAGAGGQAEGTVTGQDIRAGVHAQLALRANADLPPGATQADLEIYDRIFGRFNPLRDPDASAEQPSSPPQPASNSPSNGRGKPATASSARPQSPPAEQPAPPADQRGRALGRLDLATRIEFAVSQRRAEISQERDRALATGNAELLLRAEQMEEALTAFVAAQRAARSQAEAVAAPRPNGQVPPANLQPEARFAAEATADGALR